jgi:hypothetical protein
MPTPQTPPETARALKAGVAYWAVVFGIGFLLGTVRVLWLVPRVGEEVAVLVESPVILGASLLAAWWLTRVFRLTRVGAALVMGALAFALLMAAEVALGVAAFGMSPGEWLASLFHPPGLWGLLGQLAFALFPAGVVKARQGVHATQAGRD